MKRNAYAVAIMLQRSESFNLKTIMHLWTGPASSQDEAKGMAYAEVLKSYPEFVIKGTLCSEVINGQNP